MTSRKYAEAVQQYQELVSVGRWAEAEHLLQMNLSGINATLAQTSQEQYAGGTQWPTAQNAPTLGAAALPGAPITGPAPAPVPQALPLYVPLPQSYAPQVAEGDPQGDINMQNPMYSPAPLGPGPLVGFGIAIPIITRMALAAIAKHPVKSLIGTTSLVATAWQLLGQSPKDYLQNQGMDEPSAMLGADFVEFLERAIKEGLLVFPEVPRGYEKESFYEGLNYLNINMRTGKMWLKDKSYVGRPSRWRD